MLVLPPFYRGARVSGADEGGAARLKIRIPAPAPYARVGAKEHKMGKAQEQEDEYKDEGEEGRGSALALDARAYGRTPPRTRAASRGKPLPAGQLQAHRGARFCLSLSRV